MKYIFFSILLALISCPSKTHITPQKNKGLVVNDTLVLTRKDSVKKIEINTLFDSEKVKELSKDESSLPFMYYSNNLDENFTVFTKKAFTLDKSLDSIKHYNDNIDLYYNTASDKNFYEKVLGDSSFWIFTHYRYHDIYYAFFSFQKIKKIRVFVVDNGGNEKMIENKTFLPLSGDYEILLPDGTMKKKWYIEKVDYWDIFKGDILDNPNIYSSNQEIKKVVLDSIVNKYQ